MRKTKTYAGVVAAATLLKAILSHFNILGNSHTESSAKNPGRNLPGSVFMELLLSPAVMDLFQLLWDLDVLGAGGDAGSALDAATLVPLL